MRSIKLKKIVEYLKSNGFYHDTFDLECGIEPVLAEYGICDFLSKEESCIVGAELHNMAEQNEFNEVCRMVGASGW